MTTTSASLLERLKAATPSDPDWARWEDVYRPLIRAWVFRAVGHPSEVDDLTQDVVVVVVRELPSFTRQRTGSFRAWLRQVVVNRARAWRRVRGRLAAGDPAEAYLSQLADPASDLSRQWDRDHDRHVCHRLLAAVRGDFEPATWEAFRLFALDGLPAAEAAARTGLTDNAIMLAKSRILKRLREEAAGLLDG